ncbi:hypothetical protein [Vibrio cholerae]|uniref:hypothetical protein n=1 Tax=Vibrio cholerae TaxID=666 RepID=UPI00387DD11F
MERNHRGRGAGRLALGALIEAAKAAGSGSSSPGSSRRTPRAAPCCALWAPGRLGSTRSTPGSTGAGGTW